MRRNLAQDLALGGRFAHQTDVAVGKVAKAAVHQLRRAAAGAGRDIARLDQRDAQSALGSIAGNTGAGNARPDHDNVVGAAVQPGEGARAVAEIEI